MAGSQTLIEDLDSSNGTFINSPDRRVTKAVPLLGTDIVCFGTFSVPAARLLSGVVGPEPAILPSPSPPAPLPAPPLLEPSPEPTHTRPRVAAGSLNRWWVVLLAKALVLAVLVVLIFGREAAVPISPENWSSVGQAVASTTFALGLLAIWLGCSVATLESTAGRSLSMVQGVDSTKQFLTHGARILVLIALCAVGCAVVLAIVYWGSGLRGPCLAMWGLMLLASVVGLLLGLIVTAFSRTWITTPLVLLVCFAPMIAAGGRLWPLPELSPPICLATSAMPSRWAFEGLLLMEADASPTMPAPDHVPPELSIDLAEPYFRAKHERMGTWADALALAGILIGLAVFLGVIRWDFPSQRAG